MKTYRTAEIASLIGIHPNTVRFYEEQGLLPPIPRENNGYRIYSESHLLQLRLIRLAFRVEILSDILRCEAIDIVKTATASETGKATQKALRYKAHIQEEMHRAREAIALTERIIGGATEVDSRSAVGRREAAAQIGVSMDVLRDWERNGLLQIPRKGSRRQYGAREMSCLKIIAILRHANYSQMAVRRMLHKLDYGETNILSTIDTPEPTEDIASAADRYITSLTGALEDASEMLRLLEKFET